MGVIFTPVRWAVVAVVLLAGWAGPARSQDDQANAKVEGSIEESIAKNAEQLTAAFNAGKADEVAAMFLPSGELIDEQGTVYQGTGEIRDILNAFFAKFPGTQLALGIESIRLVGPVAIEEGTRRMTAADGEVGSQFRYIAVWSKSNRGWQLASFRDFADDPAPQPGEYLEPLSWLVGEWINEGADGKVAISYRWSDDKNFLLGEFQLNPTGGTPRKTTQRIGWDPSLGRIRSWLFDADGGFAEGFWTVDEDGVVIKSASVNPDGTTATATMHITVEDDDHFVIEGTDRVVGDTLEEDFELRVARRPPAAAN